MIGLEINWRAGAAIKFAILGEKRFGEKDEMKFGEIASWLQMAIALT